MGSDCDSSPDIAEQDPVDAQCCRITTTRSRKGSRVNARAGRQMTAARVVVESAERDKLTLSFLVPNPSK